MGGADDGGVGGEAEVVVGGEVEEGAAGQESASVREGPASGGQVRRRSRRGEVVELGAEEVGEGRGRVGGVFHVKQVGAV